MKNIKAFLVTGCNYTGRPWMAEKFGELTGCNYPVRAGIHDRHGVVQNRLATRQYLEQVYSPRGKRGDTGRPG